MKTSTLATLLLSLALGSQAAPAAADAVLPRQDSPEVARFHAFGAFNCEGGFDTYYRDLAGASDTCYSFDHPTQSVSVVSLNPKCQVTVFTQPGCTDPGVALGVSGCFSNAPAINGWKVTCPWWN
ncbi:hypothetical protein QBC46DRAFT_385395 [Diplogelasinospora grovesii]|uniref:Uncharacterized protein n=1 Tax=Diplogelasinospora grovesii TaxID=303347 RepID=A0AAN6N8L0_9PEZI|nr:hypothetical protein QBC46DRAFT_385395 [Diplogelasinospora grovesii]